MKLLFNEYRDAFFNYTPTLEKFIILIEIILNTFMLLTMVRDMNLAMKKIETNDETYHANFSVRKF